MNFDIISKNTEKQCNFSVFGPGELDWGNTYRGWTDSTGRICSRDGALFEVRSLSEKELNGTDRGIARLCIQQFQDFANPDYKASAIVIQKGKTGQTNICVFAYSNLVKFIGKV